VFSQYFSILKSYKDESMRNISLKPEIFEDESFKMTYNKLAPLQREDNDILVKEQFRLIEALRLRCQELENGNSPRKRIDDGISKLLTLNDLFLRNSLLRKRKRNSNQSFKRGNIFIERHCKKAK
jgi:hypothetical protein